MASNPNPFADEPLRIKGPRLESAASPYNPYAAPASAEEYNPLPPPGIGLWRDGPLLVMHLEANFPDRCLMTGEPAFAHRWQPVHWYYPIDFSTRTLRVKFAVSSEAQRRIRWRRTAGFLVAGCAALAMLIGVLAAEWVFPVVRGWGVLVCVVSLVAGLHYGFYGGRILKFRKVKYPYLWVQGAHEPFLNSLPTWPGTSGH